jgi:alpha-ketoglutarate-dependent taurine dioxygenase
MTAAYRRDERPDRGRGTQPRSHPFDLTDRDAYEAWRDAKLRNYPRNSQELVVEIGDSAHTSAAERQAIAERCQRANMAIYAMPATHDENEIRRDLRAFGAGFGLIAAEDHRSAEADGIVRIEVVQQGGRFGYIPYSNLPIAWHTDGYYNFHGVGHNIGAMLLHCVRAADDGGENRLLDPDIAYIRLRDLDPAYIAALSHPAAMRIPANVEADGSVRAENAGPVFFIHSPTGALAMRYTARKRNILWREDAPTHDAVAALNDILERDSLVLRMRLAPGQGLICNNVLHDRAGFSSAEEHARLLFRIRYFGRIHAPRHATR